MEVKPPPFTHTVVLHQATIFVKHKFLAICLNICYTMSIKQSILKRKNMFENFKVSMDKVMSLRGYQKIVFSEGVFGISIWGRVQGSVGMFYVLYNPDREMPPDFSENTDATDVISHVVGHFNTRQNIIHNIYTSNSDQTQAIIRNSPPFVNDSLYHCHIGVNLLDFTLNLPPTLTDIDKAEEKLRLSLLYLQNPEDESLNSLTIHAKPIAKPFFLIAIMLINVVVFVLMELQGGSMNISTLINFGAVTRHHTINLGQYWRLITPVFLHIGLTHLVFNSVSLIVFGSRAERYFGHARFLTIYILAGIAGNIAQIITSPLAVGAGASGAIFGLLGALLSYMKVRRQTIEGMTTSSLLLMITMGVLMGFVMPNIGNAAHIGGLVTGFLLGSVLTKPQPHHERGRN